jgi:hypothetical protein
VKNILAQQNANIAKCVAELKQLSREERVQQFKEKKRLREEGESRGIKQKVGCLTPEDKEFINDEITKHYDETIEAEIANGDLFNFCIDTSYPSVCSNFDNYPNPPNSSYATAIHLSPLGPPIPPAPPPKKHHKKGGKTRRKRKKQRKTRRRKSYTKKR